jgi:peptide/nickel transport system permease protein
MLGVTLAVFSAVRFLPGDVVTQILAGGYGAANPAFRASLEKQYSLNKSIPQQYVQWIGATARGDLGHSILSGRPVTQELRTRLPATFELGFLGLVVSLLIALPVGILSAIHQDSVIDLIARSFAIALLAAPSFWLALLAITYGFVWFGWTPPLHYYQIWDSPGLNLGTLWVPAIILGGGLSGSVMRLTRSTMLEVLRQDYIRTAWAKGLAGRKVVIRHAMRNAIVPVVTVIGLQIPVLVGGTVILERVFSIPGMGNYLLSSIQSRDYPVVQAVVLLSASVVILSNLLVDLLYSVIDPRIRNS